MTVTTIGKACHTGVKPIFTINGCTVHAGRIADVFKLNTFDAIIAMDEYENVLKRYRIPLVDATDALRARMPDDLFQDHKSPEVMQLRWPDQGVLPFDRAWWLQLLRSLPVMGAKVGLGCLGGHGRTGTVLSCLVGLTDLVGDNDDPVKWVRDHYCEEAVESDEQIEYVAAITGCKVLSEPSFQWGGYGYTYNTKTAPKVKGTEKASKPCLSDHFCKTIENTQRCDDCPERWETIEEWSKKQTQKETETTPSKTQSEKNKTFWEKVTRNAEAGGQKVEDVVCVSEEFCKSVEGDKCDFCPFAEPNGRL